MGKHRLDIGDTFFTTTKRMAKDRHGSTQWNKEMTGPLISYEVLRPGDERYFERGKHKYFCRVLGLFEMRTGVWGHVHPKHQLNGKMYFYKRWWQFTYWVEVVIN